ncbi:glutamate--tRNA ligase [Candidatus Woesearchaeota archaeon]|nr:glutamate--tRNA ligase [Candidatus Woesearchaeota archaeon]
MLERTIRNYTLQNAVKFKGKANPGAIIGKIIAEHPELKSEIADVSRQIAKIVKEINRLSVEEQLEELREHAPELLEKKEKEAHDLFAFLGIQPGQKVRTAFPPGPEKYPHIGHAKALIINCELAKAYNGEFYLRFEDTNPTLVKKEFYDIMLKDFAWLGVEWDKLQYASDHMQLFYDYAEYLIKEGKAYMCLCSDEAVKKSRQNSIACAHRFHSPSENLKFWKEFPKLEQGKAILRLKIDLEHQNTTMRDPTIFRIIDEPHPRQGKKYRVWPNYDFQNAIMDGKFEITHRIRSKEFELRNELQRWIQHSLNLHTTQIYEFARFNLEGVESSGRIIREKIQKGELLGWDDPSLTTLAALRRRGFTPDAIRNFVLSTGISKAEATLTWDDLIVQNRRILDAKAARLFFIDKPVKIRIKNVPHQTITLRKHPEHELGMRTFSITEDFYIPEKDYRQLENGKLYRLVDCLNFVKQDSSLIFHSMEYEHYKREGHRTMHWLPLKGNVDASILMPNKELVKGIAEHAVHDLKTGDIVQFVRFGFSRLAAPGKFWYTHE